MQLIDPKMSLDTIRSYIEVWDCKGCLPYGGTQHNVMAVDDLLYLPTIEAEPVRHGKFVFEKGDGVAFDDGWICTACKFGYHTNVPYFRSFAYCPNCGAKMDGGDSDAG